MEHIRHLLFYFCDLIAQNLDIRLLSPTLILQDTDILLSFRKSFHQLLIGVPKYPQSAFKFKDHVFLMLN